MTERFGSGYGEEGGRQPSGRGAVTERLARPGSDQADRESSGAFEPAEPAEPEVPASDPPAEDTRTGSSIFDVDERARQEDLNRTGYEPPDADADATAPSVSVADPPAATEAPAAASDAAVATDTVAPGTVADDPAAPPVAADTPVVAAEAPGSLLGALDTAEIRSRFLDIQAGFVDEPRQAVEEAGRFVDDLIRRVADALQQQRGQLAGVNTEASTEDLRLALRAYRQFVDRLLGLGG